MLGRQLPAVMISGPEHAATARFACAPCQRRKRRCDKDSRGCSTCLRLGSRCFYNASLVEKLGSDPTLMERPVPPHSIVQRAYEAGLAGNPTTNHLNEMWSLHPSLNASTKPFPDPILADALAIIGSVEEVRKCADKYFESVHTWLPIISRPRFHNVISRTPEDQESFRTGLLLGSAMYLIVNIPHDPVTGVMDESLYKRVKRLLLVGELECSLSLGLVQARLLLAVYELGHGLESAAYLTIGTCARMAIVLGIDRNEVHNDDDSNDLTLLEERSRVWWGIVIVERYINLVFPKHPMVTPDPSAEIDLPGDDDTWDSAFSQPRATIAMTTSSNIRVGPFAREAQVAYLLGRTITSISKPTADLDFNLGESLQLERTLASFMNTLPKEDAIKPCTGYCGAMGMCSSALLLLYSEGAQQQRESLGKNGHFSCSEDALNYCDFVIKRAATYTSNIATVDVDSLTPFTPYAIYQACKVQYCRLQENDARDFNPVRHDLDMLETMLASFGQRWRIAGKAVLIVRRLKDVQLLGPSLTTSQAQLGRTLRCAPVV